MSDKTLPFVITDRRKFNAEGDPRPDADPSPERDARPELVAAPEANVEAAEEPAAIDLEAAAGPEGEDEAGDPGMPPPPTAEQMEQSRLAFDATVERLDTAIRAANPGADHAPPLSFESLVQSVYMQAILQLGGGTQEGQQPQVDILGARQSIDMLGILASKSAGNLSRPEQVLLDSAIFELRLAFLEITQALARSAQQRAQQQGTGLPPAPGARPGPSLIR